ncbi:MAG TPA: hypothetical protein VNX28_04610, partial [Gemmataceae bacterium]|nr:hypothetical protein [Gemmataceae bacterium]
MTRLLFAIVLYGGVAALTPLENPTEAGEEKSADLIIHHAKVLTVDDAFRIVEAVAVQGDRILALGDDRDILKLKGPRTKLIDAQGRNVLPGLYDSHTHPVGAASSEIVETLPH